MTMMSVGIQGADLPIAAVIVVTKAANSRSARSGIMRHLRGTTSRKPVVDCFAGQLCPLCAALLEVIHTDGVVPPVLEGPGPMVDTEQSHRVAGLDLKDPSRL
jgi:hypothetical protein